jgi:hypothetical protein
LFVAKQFLERAMPGIGCCEDVRLLLGISGHP